MGKEASRATDSQATPAGESLNRAAVAVLQKGEAPHVGMDGKPCRCTPWRRRKATRGCARTCPCHGKLHRNCPDAHPCFGKCGRLTTAHESSSCGYCAHCSADARWREVV